MLRKVVIRPFQSFPVPFPQVGSGFIGFLEEAEQQPIGIIRLANRVIG
jgi:hypothetical protein